jgi:hypothetical protein
LRFGFTRRRLPSLGAGNQLLHLRVALGHSRTPDLDLTHRRRRALARGDAVAIR